MREGGRERKGLGGGRRRHGGGEGLEEEEGRVDKKEDEKGGGGGGGKSMRDKMIRERERIEGVVHRFPCHVFIPPSFLASIPRAKRSCWWIFAHDCNKDVVHWCHCFCTNVAVVVVVVVVV